MNTRITSSAFAAMLILSGCNGNIENDRILADRILQDSTLTVVDSMARKVIGEGLNAGSSYSQVWARDMNTFIETACEEVPGENLREAILLFYALQQPDGEMVDGYVLKPDFTWYDDTPYYSSNAPSHVGFKNTVETDQETSLIQITGKYIKMTGDRSILDESIGGKTVYERMQDMIEWLLLNRYDSRYGLLYGATTADWGDVQPYDEFGCDYNGKTYPAIDIYDNAMFIIALDMMKDMSPEDEDVRKWETLKDSISVRSRRYLWDEDKGKFIPHIYLEESPIPEGFDESEVHFHGGTAVAIEAGLLSESEIESVYAQMLENVRKSGMPSIGLTIYPPYPKDFFCGWMSEEYAYQNGGDWTWFGGRMVQQLASHGYVKEAYESVRPMIDRVIANNGFYEWYDKDNTPRGSGKFKGSAGVLANGIKILRQWAEENR